MANNSWFACIVQYCHNVQICRECLWLNVYVTSVECNGLVFSLYFEHLLYFTYFLHGVHPAGHMFLVYTQLTQEEKVSLHRNRFSLCLFSYATVWTTYSSCTIVIIFAQVEHGKQQTCSYRVSTLKQKRSDISQAQAWPDIVQAHEWGHSIMTVLSAKCSGHNVCKVLCRYSHFFEAAVQKPTFFMTTQLHIHNRSRWLSTCAGSNHAHIGIASTSVNVVATHTCTTVVRAVANSKGKCSWAKINFQYPASSSNQ